MAAGALRALEELGTALDTRIPTSTIDLLRVNLFRLTSFYAVMDAHDRFRLDAFATALMRRGFAMERLAADTRALAAMVAPTPAGGAIWEGKEYLRTCPSFVLRRAARLACPLPRGRP